MIEISFLLSTTTTISLISRIFLYFLYSVHWNCSSVCKFFGFTNHICMIKHSRVQSCICNVIFSHILDVVSIPHNIIVVAFMTLVLRGHHFHSHSSHLDLMEQTCEEQHKKLQFCWQMKSYYLVWCSRIMCDICVTFLFNVLLYCGRLDQAISQMTMLVAFTLATIFT